MNAMGRELRKSARRYVRQGVKLVSADGASLGVCVMHDVSATGACLGSKTPGALPDNFILLLSHDGRLRRLCSVVWRSDDSLGVQFLPDRPK